MGSLRAVNMITGVVERTRSSRHSAKPSSRGRLRSSTIRSMCSRASTWRISLPSAAVLTA